VIIISLGIYIYQNMEAEEAGVALWPHPKLRPSTQAQVDPQSESDSEEEPITSQAQLATPSSRQIFLEDRRKRKAERAALRRASKARKEARRSLSGQEKKRKKEAVLVPSSSAPSRPTSSFPEVSTSSVDDDKKKDEDVPTQSVETIDSATTAPAIESEQTESQDSASTQASPSPNRPPVSNPLGSKAAVNGDKKAKTSDHVTAPSTSGSSELDSSMPEQVDFQSAVSSTTKPRPNAEAGPSTKKPKMKASVEIPVTPRTSTKRSRESGPAKRGSPKVEDDDSLRRRLATPSAVNEFIASKYWKPPYLNRLEAAGSRSSIVGDARC